MRDDINPSIPHPLPGGAAADDSVHWRASRAFGAIACVGLLVTIWLPWFSVSAYVAGSNHTQLLSGPGFAPVTVLPWEISGSLTVSIAAAAVVALVLAARGPLAADGTWLESAMGAYWLAAAIAFLAVSAIAFGMVGLPPSIAPPCSQPGVTTATGAPAGATAATGPTACATVASGEVHTQMLFGAGISVALSVLLLASAAWGTARPPGERDLGFVSGG